MKVLIINLCYKKESLSSNEFVKPIENIVKKTKKYDIIHYLDIKKKKLKQYNKIILCGNALKDFEYLNHLEIFNFIKTFKGDVLGICAGAHIIGLVYNSKIKEGKEIGLINIKIIKEDIILNNINFDQTYALHSKYIEKINKFEILAQSQNYNQIFKHKNKNIYAILFHPEVRNKELIINFLKL
ncbi:MAG: glutamine amidotransferase-related protein [Nanoarchaeota archaeon]